MKQTRKLVRTAALLAAGLIAPAAAQEKAAAPAAAAPPGQAAEASASPSREEVEALRREIEALRRQIAALQGQVTALTAAGPVTAAPGTAAAPPAVPPYSPPPLAPPPLAVGAAAPTRSQGLMNPAISAVMQINGTGSLKHSSEENGFDLSEAELAFQSVVDPYAKVDMFLTFPSTGTPAVEEGYVTALSLPGSLQIKGGRFKNTFGKWNTLHDHAFPTVDRPDALIDFLGDDSLTSDGLSASILIPNPWDQYISSVTEIGTALGGPSFNGDHRNLTWLEHLSWVITTSPNATLEVGASAVRGKAGVSDALVKEIAGLPGLVPRDQLDSTVGGLDFTYKWKPLRMNVYRSFLWQTEVMRSHRDVDLLVAGPSLAPGAVTSSGGYTYLEWQYAKRWRVGARYDLSQFPDASQDREWASAGVVRFQPTEFQEIRLEVKHTHRNDSAALRFDGLADDTQLFFEWIPVIGAHGAHPY